MYAEKVETKVKERKENLQLQMDMLDIYEKVIINLMDSMKWDSCIYHAADDEHESTWFEEPNEDDYRYQKYKAYQKFVEKLEKFMDEKGKIA